MTAKEWRKLVSSPVSYLTVDRVTDLINDLANSEQDLVVLTAYCEQWQEIWCEQREEIEELKDVLRHEKGKPNDMAATIDYLLEQEKNYKAAIQNLESLLVNEE